MSTTNDISSTGRVTMKASPSTTERRPGAPLPDSGGIGGSRSAAYSARVNRIASME
jgi:hypothetical protein